MTLQIARKLSGWHRARDWRAIFISGRGFWGSLDVQRYLDEALTPALGQLSISGGHDPWFPHGISQNAYHTIPQQLQLLPCSVEVEQ